MTPFLAIWATAVALFAAYEIISIWALSEKAGEHLPPVRLWFDLVLLFSMGYFVYYMWRAIP